MKGGTGISESEWGLLRKAVLPEYLMEKLWRLRIQHGEPAPVCEHCRRYLELPELVRDLVEGRVMERRTA